jgi:menaquinone-dependent protoporphyrinogen oxidase
MNEVPVFFATNEGHTRRIAERVSAILRERGFSSWAVDVGSKEASAVDWRQVKGAVLGASLHLGKYQKRALAFARRHRESLNWMPSAFFGVSLSAASKNPAERAEAARIARGFPGATGWSPTRIESFAGALAYRRYGFLVRYIMKRIARKEGGPTDTTCDHDLTDWSEVTRFANEMADELLKRQRNRVPAIA